MTVAKKMVLLVAMVVLGVALLVGSNLYQMRRSFEAANYGNSNTVPSLLCLNEVVLNFTKMRVFIWQHFAQSDPAQMAALNEKIEQCVKKVTDALAKYQKEDISDAKDAEMLAADQEAISKFLAVKDKAIALSKENKKDEARDFLMANQALAASIGSDLDKHFAFNVESGQKAANMAISTQRSATIISLVASLILVVAIASLCFLIMRGLIKKLAYAMDITKAVAAGDLSRDVENQGQDEVGHMLGSIGQMVNSLREVLSRIIEISSSIASASTQLHATSAQIATGAEEVAAQGNVVATASEEMSATSTDISHNCLTAAEASRQTAESATDGANVVNQTINGMNAIATHVKSTAETVAALGTRSEQIGQIVGTIEDIADQTNLLALNAAIEAARAGDQGRGFAVVADEVRALAERTTRATREIGEMIKAIQNETKAAVKAMEEGVHEVEMGAEASVKSGHALEEILSRINEVTVQISQIATAAEEQTSTTAEVTRNIQQISEIVQQSSRGAEETSEAASQLADQSQQLQNLVSRFRVA